jgi:hypothetical protein
VQECNGNLADQLYTSNIVEREGEREGGREGGREYKRKKLKIPDTKTRRNNIT